VELAPLRDTRFVHDACDAQACRPQWLIWQEFAEEAGRRTTSRAGMIAALQRRELLRISAQLSREIGMLFAETESGATLSGIYCRLIDTLNGRFALVESRAAGGSADRNGPLCDPGRRAGVSSSWPVM
jgi:hypothetical protein